MLKIIAVNLGAGSKLCLLKLASGNLHNGYMMAPLCVFADVDGTAVPTIQTL